MRAMSGASIETTLELWASALREVKARMRPLFLQERMARSAGLFVDGLLGAERRKTGWMRAEAAGDPGPWRQQSVLGRGQWDADALRDVVRDYVLETHHLFWTKRVSSSKARRPARLPGNTPGLRARSPTAKSACLPCTRRGTVTRSSIGRCMCPRRGR